MDGVWVRTSEWSFKFISTPPSLTLGKWVVFSCKSRWVIITIQTELGRGWPSWGGGAWRNAILLTGEVFHSKVVTFLCGFFFSFCLFEFSQLCPTAQLPNTKPNLYLHFSIPLNKNTPRNCSPPSVFLPSFPLPELWYFYFFAEVTIKLFIQPKVITLPASSLLNM